MENKFFEDLIMVKHPYNRLEDYELLKDGSLKAKVQNEYLFEKEGGPIGCAEVGRHVAILGSIALANQLGVNPQYYLAVKAKLNRSNSKVYDSDFFNVKVKVLECNKRTGKIAGVLRDDAAQLLYVVEVDYKIISKPVFSQLFEKHYKSLGSDDFKSPYKFRKSLSNIQIDNLVAHGNYGVIEEQDCKGHFENFPALPVAIIGNLYSELGIHLFQELTQNKYNKVNVEYANIHAFELAFAGEEVSFKAELKEDKSSSYKLIYCQAIINNKVVSDITIGLRGVEEFKQKKEATFIESASSHH